MAYKIICTLGKQDIPVIQGQPDFAVDLLDTNIILFGAPMSGKTNFIRLIITILHKLYTKNDEQIFILDFGGALTDVENLPLVSAYFDNANEEYVKRVFKLLEDQLKINNKKLQGKNFRDVDSERPIHTTLFIDNVNAFLDEPRYSAYHEKLAKLCRDGRSKGITVILTASSTKGLMSYMPNFKQKIALEMPADSYSEIFSHGVIPVGSNPGHGYANVTIPPEDTEATFPMQTAYEIQINRSDDVNSEAFRKNCEKKFGSEIKKKYQRFPDALTPGNYRDYMNLDADYDDDEEYSDFTACVGLDYTECREVLADFGLSRITAIYGKKGFGKTNLLRRILKELSGKKTGNGKNFEWNYVFFDDGRKQLEEFYNLYKNPDDGDETESPRAKYINFSREEPVLVTKTGTFENIKLSPIQRFIKYIHEGYMDLTNIKRLSSKVTAEIFGSGYSPVFREERRNTIFVLQSKFLFVNTMPSLIFMTIILPLMAARAEEMNWIFIFSDVRNITESEMKEYFNSNVGTAFLLDNIAEFVGERGIKSVFGQMDVKSLKEEYARCEEGDGYIYSIEKDELKKLKFIKEEGEN